MLVSLLMAAGLSVSLPVLESCLAGFRHRLAIGEDACLEQVRLDLASQPSSRQVALVLVRHIREVSGAAGVSLCLFDQPREPFAAHPQAPRGEPTAALPLGVRERDIGEVYLYGRRLVGGALLRRILNYGGLALHNAMLAESASEADLASAQARIQRDLQHRLAWSVSIQIAQVLDETQRLLEAVGSRLAIPSSELATDLLAIADRLLQLESLVKQNLKTAEQETTS